MTTGYLARIVNGIVWVRMDLGLGRPEWVAVGDVLPADERSRRTLRTTRRAGGGA